MLRSGHRGIAGVLLYPMTALFMYIYPDSPATLVMICLLYALSTIPDIDQPIIDRYGSNIQIGSKSFELSHRGFSHTAYGSIALGVTLLLVCIPLIHVFSLDGSYIVAISIAGFLCVPLHCLGDIFTPSGIDHVPPFTSGFSLGWFYYDNSFANLGSFLVGILGLGLSLSHYLQPLDVQYWLPLSVILLLFLVLVLSISKKIPIRFEN